jgi:hypothetical protein
MKKTTRSGGEVELQMLVCFEEGASHLFIVVIGQFGIAKHGNHREPPMHGRSVGEMWG